MLDLGLKTTMNFFYPGISAEIDTPCIIMPPCSMCFLELDVFELLAITCGGGSFCSKTTLLFVNFVVFSKWKEVFSVLWIARITLFGSCTGAGLEYPCVFS